MAGLYDTVDKSLYKIQPQAPMPTEFFPENIGSGAILSDMNLQVQSIQSGNYKINERGWKIDAAGNMVLGSIVWNRQTLISNFESLDGWEVTQDGTGTASAGIGRGRLVTGTTIDNDTRIAALTNDDLVDFDNKPSFFHTRFRLEQTTDQQVNVTVGYEQDGVDVYGFTITDNTLKAITRVDPGTSTTTTISGITLTNLNTCRAELFPGKKVEFYVNGNLVAVHTTNLPGGTETAKLYYNIRTTAAAAKAMIITQGLFSQEF